MNDRTRFARLLGVASALVGVAGAALAQDPAAPPAPPAPAEVERVYVPERALERVIERHPRGVIVRDQELDELLRRAGVRPAPVVEVAPPLAAAIRHVRVSGAVRDGVATLDCEAEVTVLARGEVALLLPLRGVGLRRVSVDGAPARVLPDAQGVRVLLAGAASSTQPTVHEVGWQLGVRVEPGEERGAGSLRLVMPSTASGKLQLLVPGDVEVVLPAAAGGPAQQTQLSRGRTTIQDDGQASRGCVAWAAGLEGDATRVDGAFGGAASADRGEVVVSWRPRRSATDVTPYVVADERSIFCVRQGVVTLDAVAALEVYRAGRDHFALDLPPGFVVRALAVEGEEATHVQRGDRVDLTLGAPRTGRVVARLRAELVLGMGGDASTGMGGGPDGEAADAGAQQLVLQPLGFPDADRASGLVGLAQGEGTVVTFQEVLGLDRADAGELGATQPRGDTLLRVYRRLPAPGRLTLAAAPQAPRVDLVHRSVVGLGERELRALTIYQFRVQEGRVFRLTADVPGFAVETVQLREVRAGAAREPVHQLTIEAGHVLVELQQALRAGDELFLNVQAVREEPQGLAGRTLEVPRVSGSPATSTRGHIGFAPDEAYRLTGSGLAGLTAIPAAELPRAGLDVAGLVLGYRIDAADYAGQLHLTPRETRVSAQVTTHHRVAERVVETDALVELDIEGAPVTTLELLLPRGVGRLARIEAPDLKDDRELLGPAGEGDDRERWRLTFEQRKSGALPLRVRFDTTVQSDVQSDVQGDVQGDASAPAGGQPGGQAAEPTIELPRVSVAGAFRERGAVAVFSSDATELQAQAQGLRTLEVTDVPALPGSAFAGRPLFAFTHTAAEHRLKLTVKRRDAASILQAVVERVDLKTSAAPDGLSRHEAVFHVRHLEAQFFALRLPEGATLWSVVVGGQGVKPAEKDGLKIVPMPSLVPGSAPRPVETVSVTYTLRREAWGVLSRADLLAPELLIDRDRPVPVLRTSWALALPDDYRVLEFAGNLRGAEAEAARPLALGLWRSASHMGFGLAFLALALGVGASARARLWLAAALGRSGASTRSAGQVLTGVASHRGVRLGCAALVVLGLLFFCVTTSFRGGHAALEQSDVSMGPAAAMDKSYDDDSGPSWGAGAPGAAAPADAPRTETMFDDAVGADMELIDELSMSRDNKEEAQQQGRRRQEPRPRRMREDADVTAPPSPPPPATPVPAPRPARPGRPQPQAAGPANDQRGARLGARDHVAEKAGAEGGESAALAEGEQEEADGAPRPSVAPDEDQGFASPMEPSPKEPSPAEPSPEGLSKTNADENGAATTLELLEAAGKKLQAAVSDDAALGRVGLRSLLLDLPAVGRGASFQRPGGKAQLVVQLVREDALTLGAGALALLGLLAGLLLPGRARVSYLGLLLVTLAVATSLPYVLADARLTPLLNALAVGALLAGPVHAARGLRAMATQARAATTFEGPRDEALHALALLCGALAVPCLGLTALALSGRGSNVEAVALFGVTSATLVMASLGLLLRVRWALLPALLAGLGQAGLGALVLQDAVRHGPGAAAALTVAWVLLFGVAGLGALALLTRPGRGALAGAAAAPTAAGGMGRGLAALLFALLLLGASPARADEPPPAVRPQGPPPRVYVPYDPATPDVKPTDVYVPEDVYLDLWRRAYPDKEPAPRVTPPVAHALGQVAYEGALGADGLTLTARIEVEVLAEGWIRCPLGLAGTGLREGKVQSGSVGGKPGARVRVAPAGGLELVAQGPGAYVVTLDLVVPARDGGYVFAAIPAQAATLRVRSTIPDRRVVVGGARAQTEEQAADGALVVDASLGDAPRVHLTLPGREVLSTGGASEAAAHNASVLWVRRGRVVVLSQVTFSITGAGREGFLFDVPPGFEVTSVQTEALRAWRLDEQGRLELTLRRPTGARATVLVWGEQVLAPDVTRFTAPQLVAQGVSREAGVLGVCVEEGLRVRPVDPAPGLRQVAAGPAQGLANTLRAGTVERAYEFARRPAELALELVQEAVEVKADVDVRATIEADRMTLHAEVAYDVRRGKVHEVAVAVPAGFTLAQAPRGLDVREAPVVSDDEAAGARTYRFGLATGLAGQARLVLVLERALSGEQRVPFPDVRPLGVAWETTAVAIAAGQGLRVRPQQDPPGLQARDVRAATRGRPAPAGCEWVLAYQRPNGRVAGLATAGLAVSRPAPRVTGSWTLHARVERDVVRYTLRAVYGIADAGASAFHLLLPADVVERVRVDAQNQREVRSEPAGDGVRRLTIELQSPAEEAYELGATWEEVLTGPRFTIPQVALDGVERQARRFVLVEAAPDVPDKLEPAGVTGAVEPARASEAPVLPGPASDFAYAYRLGAAEGPWSASFALKPREVRLPPAARIPWAELTSVFTTDGVVRHRARYRVHNLRLQFLRLQLPAQAEVWSVFVGGAPRRLHHEEGLTLVPLPKGTDADLSFDVELVFATPLPGEFGFGGAFTPEAPTLRTPDVQVERTSWTLFVPQAYEARGFSGNLQVATVATSRVQAVVEEVNELKKLVDLAENASGSTRAVAEANLQTQLARVQEQLQMYDALGADKAAPVDREVLGKNRQEVLRLSGTLAARTQQQGQVAGQDGQAGEAAQVTVDGKSFDRLDSGWYSNNEVTGASTRTRWAGVGQTAQGPGRAQSGDSWTLSIPEGQPLSLANAEVFSGDYAPQSELEPAQQQAQNSVNLQRARRLLDNRGYDEAQEDVARKQVEQAQRQAQTYGYDVPAEELGGLGERLRRRQNAPTGAPQGELDAATSIAATRGLEPLGGAMSLAGRSEGLLSIQVPFETPGRAYHFSTDTQEAPTLAFSVYPQGVGEQARRAGRGLVLLVLLLGLLRLGLLAPTPGRAPLQALLLLGAGALAASVFVHVAGAVAALAAGLWGLRRGPGLLASDATEAAPAP